MAILLLASSAAALAHWTGAGAGTGSGAAGSAQDLTVTAAAPSTQLFPGGSADVALTISNPNPFVLHVGALTLDTTQGAGGFAVDATHGSCGLSSLSFATQTNGGAGWSVPARVGGTDGTLALDLPNAASMTAGAPGACQGASFTIYLAGGP